jgi:hypothetical protein
MAMGDDDDDDDDDIDVTAQGAIPWENAHFYVPDSERCPQGGSAPLLTLFPSSSPIGSPIFRFPEK